MAHAIRIDRFGGPEVMRYQPVEVGDPAAGQVRIRHTAIGLNMVDTYYRSGLYPRALPSGLGSEAAGVITAAGPDVTGYQVGDRVAYPSAQPLDAYSEERLIEPRWLVHLPDEIPDPQAAAMMLKGLTSWYLLTQSYAVRRDDWILLYAAAGGVGSIASQWAASFGAHVIGVVGSEPKRRAALANGCAAVLLAGDDIVARVRELTGGQGVPAVYDSVGRDTFMQSLDCLRPHGVMVSFGNASGPAPAIAPLELMKRGSLFLTRPTLSDFISEPGELDSASAALFERVASGAVKIEIGQSYPLARAADAHRDLQAKKTRACSVLEP